MLDRIDSMLDRVDSTLDRIDRMLDRVDSKGGMTNISEQLPVKNQNGYQSSAKHFRFDSRKIKDSQLEQQHKSET